MDEDDVNFVAIFGAVDNIQAQWPGAHISMPTRSVTVSSQFFIVFTGTEGIRGVDEHLRRGRCAFAEEVSIWRRRAWRGRLALRNGPVKPWPAAVILAASFLSDVEQTLELFAEDILLSGLLQRLLPLTYHDGLESIASLGVARTGVRLSFAGARACGPAKAVQEVAMPPSSLATSPCRPTNSF